MSSDQVSGKVLKDEIIPAREYTAFTLRWGDFLRIMDVEGKQVPDLICFNSKNLEEKVNYENTKLLNETYNPTVGHIYYSDDCTPMMTVIADTVRIHYPSGAFCSEELNLRRYGIPHTRNCRDNLAMAVAPWGIPKHELPGAFGVFMNVAYHPGGRFEIVEPTSKPGDYIDLRAEMDLLVAISNCPQEHNPCNGFNPTPLRLIVYEATAESV